ncbi:MAG: chromosome segregation protein SMC [Burkholderiales bacterium]|nr:chromosome segregation protein SMC [Burkholderiales bacterium]
MRLTHIKLAGFKSFVDPTHVALPGQLIGVVGPNGCGKSNVIDAVRWVLGESSAKHLRGESMDDVIFNGSGERKPVGRASVELVFDNSLGKAAGAWSQYAEISIKRVLERDSGSSYFINNTAVRRRDVADIFLGTGLGARAYAIIEQGMISRIVEAKPEELRIFLEEAAGVSKYRERRKETEARLDDTKENLLRVDDIRRELQSQITHLEAQAEAAEKYRSLEAQLRQTQHLLWAIRRQDAAAQRAKAAREVEQLTIDIEQAGAALRDAEKRLEALREGHYTASDAVHAAQGQLYESNAELARIEQELAFLRANRQRAEARAGELRTQIDEEDQRHADLDRTLTDTRSQLATVTEEAAHRREALQAIQEQLPAAEQAYRDARAESERLQQALAEARRSLEVASTRREHAEKLVTQLEARNQRLAEEREALVMPDTEALEQLQADALALDDEIAALRQRQSDAEQALPGLEQRFREATQGVEQLRQKLASVEARRNALVGLQQQVGASEQMAAWLGQHGLSERPRLWQHIRVDNGWEDALEAVLRERLNAIAVQDPGTLTDWFGASPPGKLAIYRSGPAAGTETPVAPAGTVPLLDRVSSTDEAVKAVLREWLDRVYAVDSAATALDIAARLGPGEMVVTRDGHMFTAHSVGFHAADSEIHGLLERKEEIEQLEAEVPHLEAGLAERRGQLADAEMELAEQRSAIDRLRGEITDVSERRHEIELEEVRASQAVARARERHDQIDRELAEIAAEREREHEDLQAALEALGTLDAGIVELQAQVGGATERDRQAEMELGSLRERVLRAERDHQEAQFGERTAQHRIGELERTLSGIADQLTRARNGLAQAEAEVAGFDEAPIAERLQAVLAVKMERETALASARDAMAEAETVLRSTEQERLSAEQRLEPMRNRIGDLKLKEQEARLNEESYAQQLAEAKADEAELLASVEKAPRPNALQGDINRLSEEIAALGAVNLAALDELATARERNGYLETQSADLTEAMNTLVEAIRRIDRETRDRLRATFDEVNQNLGQMFPALFGGGEAKLVMSGEEILDSGVQIVARPPGKKNSSIHLLSGGEKALTAVSLVFSLFRLNPAPFCLLDEVDAPLDDSNTGRFCELVKKMADQTQFIFISHNKITMEMADQLIGVTMPELGVSRVVAVDIEEALKLREEAA